MFVLNGKCPSFFISGDLTITTYINIITYYDNNI